ncbi:MAG: Rab family GTPase [Candidatus Hodarchaeales archaeon]|jgi:small GTP-binding protein
MRLIKVCLLGDDSKTELREKYLGRGFQSNYMTTIGADFCLQEIEVDGEVLKFQIWDLKGQQRFRTVRSVYYIGSLGAIFVFDLLNRESLANLFGNWLGELMQNTNFQIPLILVGNNVDLRNGNNPDHITNDQGRNAAKRIAEIYGSRFGDTLDVPYIETSSRTGENVILMFQILGGLALQYLYARTEDVTPKLSNPISLKDLNNLINRRGGKCYGCRITVDGLLCANCFNGFKEDFKFIPASVFYLGNYFIPTEYEEQIVGRKLNNNNKETKEKVIIRPD